MGISVISINVIELSNDEQTFDKEDELNLEMDDVNGVEAAVRFKRFDDNVLINGMQVPNSEIEISRTAMDSLYEKVKDRPTDKKCLTGLYIFYACKIIGTTHIFYPIYQPVFLTWEKYDEYSLTHLYVTTYEDAAFHFDGTDFIQCVNDEASEWRRNYRTYVRLNTSNTPGTFISFRNNIDAEGLFFPFQLIYRLMKDNDPSRIILKSCMTEFSHHQACKRKHSMLLKSPLGSGSGDFTGKYANRSHLCPPCGRFGFALNDQ